MKNLMNHLERVKRKTGIKGWIMRTMFSWVVALFTDVAQDIEDQKLLCEETKRQCQNQQWYVDQFRKQSKAEQENFERFCENLRNNNEAIATLQGDVDCLKIQQRQAQRQAAKIATAKQAVGTAVATAPEQTYQAIEYFDFENHFRGSIEHIKEVQRQYLPYFVGKQHVLDLGCGRGEFLSLMQENGIPAEGVDIYEPYVDYCNSQGLKATCGDGTAYLGQMAQVDGIFVGQVVEHLTPEQILSLCDTAYEKLSEGGCLIIETPNPTSLSIYTNAFYIDPSHVKPVHPLTMQYYLEKAGFRKTELLYTESSRPANTIPPLHCDCDDVEEFNAAMQQVAQMLYGSQDYAIIAVK